MTNTTPKNSFINAYKNMRRLRRGLHQVRGPKVRALEAKYSPDFQEAKRNAGRAPVRYLTYKHAILEQNAIKRKARETFLRERTYQHKQRQAFERTCKKEGMAAALRRHSFATKPITSVPEPQYREVHSEKYFRERIDIYGDIKRFIQTKLKELGDAWLYGDEGELSVEEQFERRRILIGIGAGAQDREQALEAVRKFLHEAYSNQSRLDALYTNKKVPTPNSHANQHSRLVRLAIGELLRFPCSASFEHSLFFADRKMVSKLAKMLLSLDQSTNVANSTN